MKLPRFLCGTDNINAFTKLPIVEIAGPNRVLVENHLGVLAYSLDEIQIKVTYGKLSVSGHNLKLMQLSREQLVITGTIECLQLLRR